MPLRCDCPAVCPWNNVLVTGKLSVVAVEKARCIEFLSLSLKLYWFREVDTRTSRKRLKYHLKKHDDRGTILTYDNVFSFVRWTNIDFQTPRRQRYSRSKPGQLLWNSLYKLNDIPYFSTVSWQLSCGKLLSWWFIHTTVAWIIGKARYGKWIPQNMHIYVHLWLDNEEMAYRSPFDKFIWERTSIF